MKISIVVPAHNEEDNLPLLVNELYDLIKREKLDAEIVLVDDNSDDSTPELCDSLGKKYENILIMHRVGNRGMGNALKEGTKKASGDVIVWIMADLSDDLNTIPEFLEKLKDGYDVVFGSRYMKGGSSGDLSFLKTLASNGFTKLSRLFMGVNVHDTTNAFRAFKKSVFNSLDLKSGDYGISPEFALKAHLAGFKLSEAPTTYKNRKKGIAKFNMLKMGKRYSRILLENSFDKMERKIAPYKSSISAFIFYLFLTLVMTYPVIFNMNLFAGSIGDVYELAWPFWWLEKALFELKTNPLYTYNIFYPSGVSLTFFTFSHFNALISLFIQPLFSLATTYNLILLFSFVMSGFGTFLLVKHLTKNSFAAFVSGLIFAFAPYKLTQALGHIHTATTQWIPFFVLFLIKSVEENKWRNSVLAALFLALVALSSWEYFLFVAVFTIIFLSYNFFSDRKKILNKHFILKFLLMIVLFFVFVSPVALPMIKESLSHGYMKKPLDPTIVTSADFFAFFIPSEHHPLFGGYVKEIYEGFSYQRMERIVFVGYTVLSLSFYSIFKIKKTEIRFWSLIALCFFILSLGPVLHIFGRFLFSSPFKIGDMARSFGVETSELGHELMNNFIGVPLPYTILHLWFPFFSVTRCPSRLSLILMLSLAVLVGYAITNLIERFKSKKTIFIITISCLILFEFITVPFPSLSSSIPKFYQKIAEDKEDYAIVEVPVISTISMYYQTYHGKKIVGGEFQRRPNYTEQFIGNTPLLRELKASTSIRKTVHNEFLETVARQNPEAAPIIQKYIEAEGDVYSYFEDEEEMVEPSKADIDALRQSNIRYIIFDKKFLDEETLVRMSNLVENVLEADPIYFDEDTLVYEIK